jgi:hypothetical protein
VWPALFLVGALALVKARRGVVSGAVAATAVTVAAALGFGLGSLLTDFLSYQKDRGLQVEAIAALPLLWADQLGMAAYDLKFQFGAQQVKGHGTDAIGELLSVLMLVSMASLTAYCLLHRRRLLQRPETAMFAAFVALLVLVVTNKVFSPQYMLWILVPLAALAKEKSLVTTRLLGVLLAATALTHILFPFLYADLLAGQLLPLLVLTARDACVVVAMLISVRTLARAGVTTA